MERIEAIIKNFADFMEKARAFFGDDEDGSRVIHALSLSVKPTFHGFEFKDQKFPVNYIKKALTDLLMDGYLEYNDDLSHYAEFCLWKYQMFPEEGVVEHLCRKAKEPPVCPWCGRYAGGGVNEIWLSGDEGEGL